MPLCAGPVSYAFALADELTRTDNTMLAIQYATSLGIEESQIREMLGISKWRTT